MLRNFSEVVWLVNNKAISSTLISELNCTTQPILLYEVEFIFSKSRKYVGGNSAFWL